jgi:preprotein translocase subunit SecG
LDSKLARWTKWIAAAFVLLTLFVSLLYTAL